MVKATGKGKNARRRRAIFWGHTHATETESREGCTSSTRSRCQRERPAQSLHATAAEAKAWDQTSRMVSVRDFRQGQLHLGWGLCRGL